MIDASNVRNIFDYMDGQLFWATGYGRKCPKGKLAGSQNEAERAYRVVKYKGKKYFIHRVIWLWHHGWLPEQVDHINQDAGDNRIENLRASAPKHNSQNKLERIRKSKDGRYAVLAYFDTYEEAAAFVRK